MYFKIENSELHSTYCTHYTALNTHHSTPLHCTVVDWISLYCALLHPSALKSLFCTVEHYCTFLRTISQLFTVLQYTLLQCTSLFRTHLHCTELHCTGQRFTLHCIYITEPHFSTLYRIEIQSIALYCAILYCTLFSCFAISLQSIAIQCTVRCYILLWISLYFTALHCHVTAMIPTAIHFLAL